MNIDFQVSVLESIFIYLFFCTASLKKVPQCPILPGSCPPSTFGAGRLYFCVRYGNRCGHSAIITKLIQLCFVKTNRFDGALAVRPAKFFINSFRNLLLFHKRFLKELVFLVPTCYIYSIVFGDRNDHWKQHSV